jgi:hypothetical protein
LTTAPSPIAQTAAMASTTMRTGFIYPLSSPAGDAGAN